MCAPTLFFFFQSHKHPNDIKDSCFCISWQKSASIPVCAFKGISAFKMKPYRHVKVMSMDLCRRQKWGKSDTRRTKYSSVCKTLRVWLQVWNGSAVVAWQLSVWSLMSVWWCTASSYMLHGLLFTSTITSLCSIWEDQGHFCPSIFPLHLCPHLHIDFFVLAVNIGLPVLQTVCVCIIDLNLIQAVWLTSQAFSLLLCFLSLTS